MNISKNIIITILVLILAVAIPVTVRLAQQQQQLKTRAEEACNVQDPNACPDLPMYCQGSETFQCTGGYCDEDTSKCVRNCAPVNGNPLSCGATPPPQAPANTCQTDCNLCPSTVDKCGNSVFQGSCEYSTCTSADAQYTCVSSGNSNCQGTYTCGSACAPPPPPQSQPPVTPPSPGNVGVGGPAEFTKCFILSEDPLADDADCSHSKAKSYTGHPSKISNFVFADKTPGIKTVFVKFISNLNNSKTIQRSITLKGVGGVCSGTLQPTCSAGTAGLSASWSVEPKFGCNIYIKDVKNLEDRQISTDCSGSWSGTSLPGGKAIAHENSYRLFLSNGDDKGSCYNKDVSGSITVNCPAAAVGKVTIGGKVTTRSEIRAAIPNVVINQGVTDPKEGGKECNIGTATTDSKGDYRFTNVAKDLLFCLRPPQVQGFQSPPPSKENLKASADKTDYNFEYTPTPISQTVTIRGTLKRSDNIPFLDGHQVNIFYDGKDHFVGTASNGQFSLDVPQGKLYAVRPKDLSGYAKKTDSSGNCGQDSCGTYENQKAGGSPDCASSCNFTYSPFRQARCTSFSIKDSSGRDVTTGLLYQNQDYTFNMTMTNLGATVWKQATHKLKSVPDDGNTIDQIFTGFEDSYDMVESSVAKDEKANFSATVTANTLPDGVDRQVRRLVYSMNDAQGKFGGYCKQDIQVNRPAVSAPGASPTPFPFGQCGFCRNNPQSQKDDPNCENPAAIRDDNNLRCTRKTKIDSKQFKDRCQEAQCIPASRSRDCLICWGSDCDLVPELCTDPDKPFCQPTGSKRGFCTAEPQPPQIVTCFVVSESQSVRNGFRKCDQPVPQGSITGVLDQSAIVDFTLSEVNASKTIFARFLKLAQDARIVNPLVECGPQKEKCRDTQAGITLAVPVPSPSPSPSPSPLLGPTCTDFKPQGLTQDSSKLVGGVLVPVFKTKDATGASAVPLTLAFTPKTATVAQPTSDPAGLVFAKDQIDPNKWFVDIAENTASDQDKEYTVSTSVSVQDGKVASCPKFIVKVPKKAVIQPTDCGCVANACSAVCNFTKLSNVTYNDPIKCSLSPTVHKVTPSSQDKDNWCKRATRTLGDADGDGDIDEDDYLYYLTVVSGGQIPTSVNPDFDGDGVVGDPDLAIWRRQKGK